MPYKPRMVVLYAGDNDMNDGRTPGQLLADYRTFVALVRRELPTTRIVFVSIKPSPSRWAVVEAMHMTAAGYALWRELMEPVVR